MLKKAGGVEHLSLIALAALCTWLEERLKSVNSPTSMGRSVLTASIDSTEPGGNVASELSFRMASCSRSRTARCTERGDAANAFKVLLRNKHADR